MNIGLDQTDADWVNDNILIQWVHDDPTFAYTIGLWKFDLPELIVVNMTMEQSGMTLNLIAARMHKYGAFKVGDIDRDLFQSPILYGAVAAKEVISRMTRTVAAAYPHGVPPLWDLVLFTPGVLQTIWADRRGIFPDEPGYDRQFIKQKVLS